jgi:hypothetical protein
MPTLFPHLGRIMPDGSLRVPIAGNDGERWDGAVSVLPSDPRYAPWLEIMQSHAHFEEDLLVETAEGSPSVSVTHTRSNKRATAEVPPGRPMGAVIHKLKQQLKLVVFPAIKDDAA